MVKGFRWFYSWYSRCSVIKIWYCEEGLPICYGRCIYCKGSYSGRNRGFPGICIGRGRGCKAYHGRILSEKELQDIKDLVEKYLDVKIVFDTPTSLGLHSIIRSYKEKIENSDTIFQRGSVRSGQKIEAKGSVVIIGDVNAGAEVIAGDNIIVQGNLRGLAHAGAKGNKDAIITAGNLEALQVRISNIVKEIDKTDNFNVARAYICVKNDKIEIEKW